jgi:hypothetical protein
MNLHEWFYTPQKTLMGNKAAPRVYHLTLIMWIEIRCAHTHSAAPASGIVYN